MNDSQEILNAKNMKISVLTSTPRLIDEKFLDQLRTICPVDNYPDVETKNSNELEEILGKTDVAVTGWRTPLLPEGYLKNPGKLKYICHMTGEMKRIIPLSYLDAGIRVTNWGTSVAFATAEATMALLLTVLKHIPHLDRSTREKGKADYIDHPVLTLHGTRIGIYGLSSIGRRVADLLRSFGPKLSFYDPTVTDYPEDLKRFDSLTELFANNDIVSIHAGLNPATRGSVSSRELGLLREGGILINTARGSIVVEEDLASALRANRLFAGVDVIVDEKDWRSSPLADLPNVVLTGHCLSRIGVLERELLQRTAFRNIHAYFLGKSLDFEVDHERYVLMT